METTTAPAQNNELLQIIKTSGLDKTKSKVLLDKFSDFFLIAEDWKKRADELVIYDVNQKVEMAAAGEGRKYLKKKRNEVENTRKLLKEESLTEGQTIDAIARVLKGLIEPIEISLGEKEMFVEIKAAEERQVRAAARLEIIRPFDSTITESVVADMNEEMFETFLSGTKSRQAEKIETERIAEEEKKRSKELEELRWKRAESIKPYYDFFEENVKLVDLSESDFDNLVLELKNKKANHEANQEKTKLENESLKKEAEEREATIKAEKAELEEIARLDREQKEEQLRKEREEREKVEAELKAKNEAEEKAIADKAAEEKAARLAPDKIKLLNLAKKVEELQVHFPEMSTDEGLKILAEVKILFGKISTHIRTRSENL